MNSAEIRRRFLEYFVRQGHRQVESSSLVPDRDPSLLFTNSGMVQFKEALALREVRGYTRAVSCQRCMRAGGKHNDLDRVGYTARHHTFFEMLGNFSFGDYFKRDAIRFAWEFLTDENELAISPERLWVTVHESDDEAADIWLKELGVSPDRFSRLGDADNFWAMGDTGPCGPCSEIFYDHGPAVPGGPPGSPDGELDRYVEIWNLVFTQFERAADGTLAPLPKPCVDTGMGLERVAAVMQGVQSNYDTDILGSLVRSVAKIVPKAKDGQVSLQVIADHIRSAAFLVADGVLPSNEGRGYVLRRVLRRALRHGHKLGAREAFFHRLVEPLATLMGDAYPQLRQMREQIARVLLKEEEQFALTLGAGMKLLQELFADTGDDEVPGELVFRLYDTYGFPYDLLEDIARERGRTLDKAGFDAAMQSQKERARAAGRFGAEEEMPFEVEGATEFTGYQKLSGTGSLLGLYRDAGPVEHLSEGETGYLVLDKTPFYAESGGQVGDRGRLRSPGGRAQVLDTGKQGDVHLHKLQVTEGVLSVGDQVQAEVNQDKRRATRLNHSATHLMHAALRKVLGEHVRQRGSLVDEHRLRFDFSHFEPVTLEQQRWIENLVNEQIRGNSPVRSEEMSMDEAVARGALALFGEKYSEQVRVLSMGEVGMEEKQAFSMELCGGTHASRTGDLGLFKLISEQGIASGVRRIEAVTGEAALQLMQTSGELLDAVTGILKVEQRELPEKVASLDREVKELKKKLDEAAQKLALQGSPTTDSGAVEVKGVQLLVRQLEGLAPRQLPSALDQLKNLLGSGVVVLASVHDGKAALIAGVTRDLTDRISAVELVNEVASRVGGKGGGRPEMARAGGANPAALPEAMAAVQPWLAARL